MQNLYNFTEEEEEEQQRIRIRLKEIEKERRSFGFFTDKYDNNYHMILSRNF